MNFSIDFIFWHVQLLNNVKFFTTAIAISTTSTVIGGSVVTMMFVITTASAVDAVVIATVNLAIGYRVFIFFED
jgi:uncharacterized protein YcsI (UPF0317 family)